MLRRSLLASTASMAFLSAAHASIHGSAVSGGETISVNTPPTLSAGVSATFTGSYVAGPPASVDYQFDSAGWNAASATITGGTITFTATAPTAGTHTLSIRDRVNPTIFGTSGMFATQNAAIAVATPGTLQAGSPTVFTGTYAGTQPTALDYEFDSAGYALVSSPTIGGGNWSFTANAPAAGSHTLSVRDHNVTSTSGTSGAFSTVSGTLVAGTPDITVPAANPFTFSGRYTGTAPAGLNYKFDSGSYVAAVNPSIGNGFWSFIAASPAAGSHTLTVQNSGVTAIAASSNSFTTVAMTVVNIRKAPVWANGTFTVGERCTNPAGSLAFTCIVPGTSTGAPIVAGTSVNNGGIAAFSYSSAVNYTAINSWVTAKSGTTLTNPTLLQVWNDTPGTTWIEAVKVTGIVTPGTNGITLMPAAGEGAWDNPTRHTAPHALTNNSNYGVQFQEAPNGSYTYYTPTIYFNVLNANVIGIQTLNNGRANGCNGILLYTVKGTVAHNVIMDDGFHDSGPLGLNIYNAKTGGTIPSSAYVFNNLMVGQPPGYRAIIAADLTNNSVIENNTMIVPDEFTPTGTLTFGFGGSGMGNAMTIRNNIIMGFPSALGYTPNGAGQMGGVPDGHNATDQTSLGVSQNTITVGNVFSVSRGTSTFVQPAFPVGTFNARLAMGSPLIGVASQASAITSVDFFGFPRNSPSSIGAHDP